MSLLKKVLAVLVGIPLLFVGTAFVHAVYLKATDQEKPKVLQDLSAKDAPPEAAPATSPSSSNVHSPGAPDVPTGMDALAMTTWLQETKFFYVEGEDVKCDTEKLNQFTVDDAHAIYAALRSGGKEHQSMRLHFFAWMGELAEEKRELFAARAGAVDRPSDVSKLSSYTGDFSRILFLQTKDSESIYARAVRNYARVLESNAILKGLEYIDAIDIDPSQEQWHVRVEEKMEQFDPDTLMAIRNGIDKALYGNRNYVRDALEKLAKSKR